MIRTVLLAIVFSTAAFCRLDAQERGNTSHLHPGEIGLSAEKLQRITEYLQHEVDEGRIAGGVAAISRHGSIGYSQAVGYSELTTKRPMQSDSLFRIASMTKVITSAAVMSLVEDGTVSLDDPLSKHLPVLAKLRVLERVDGESTETVAAEREPTIRDLLIIVPDWRMAGSGLRNWTRSTNVTTYPICLNPPTKR